MEYIRGLMRSLLAVSPILFALLAFSGSAGGTDKRWQSGSISIEQAWARFSPRNPRLGAVYLTTHNNSQALDYLIGAESPIAKSVAIYESKSVNGEQKLVPIPGGLNLADHQEIVMRPDGIQLILSGLKVLPRPGQTVPLRLIFLNADSLNIEVPVHPLYAAFPEVIHRGHKPRT